jgi:hypothetical protein
MMLVVTYDVDTSDSAGAKRYRPHDQDAPSRGRELKFKRHQSLPC